MSLFITEELDEIIFKGPFKLKKFSGFEKYIFLFIMYYLVLPKWYSNIWIGSIHIL